MKALFVEAPGEPPSLPVRDVDVPAVGPHDVLVEVAACGLCHHDVAVMAGTLRRGVKPGVILGHEISGRVAKVGGSVTCAGIGDRVVATLTTFCGACARCARCASGREYRCLHGQGIGHAIDGGFAQFVRLPERSLVKLPDGVDLIEAAILACPVGVALQAIRDVARVKTGETVLVTGAGGGLGVHAVQIAAALGARVLAITTSPEKVALLEELRAGEVVLSGELDFAEVALALTEEQGVDVVINTVGSAVFRSSLHSLGQFGRMVILGEITGEQIPVNPAEILFRDAAIIGSTGAGRRHIADAAEMVRSGLVRPIVSQRFDLKDAFSAYSLLREKKTFGRVVLVP